ncbi:MAG: YdcF family protein [Chlorobiaceae bacterium]|nr:YdcF family protein [Chlorobiaceae bacterium]
MKVFVKVTLIFLFTVSSAAAIFFLSLGFVVSLHAGNPEQSDVIIVLGGDNGLRVRKGAELYKAGYAAHVIVTGIDEKFYHPGHPNWRERRMMALGVPKNAIKVDTKSTTSWEEAENTSDTMKKKGWKSALVVSDPPHMLRLYETWSKAFEGSSKKFILVPTNPIWWHPMLWWKNEKSYQFVMNEIKKNLFYAVVYY